MVTTIQVSDETKYLLQLLKEKEHADSYDKVLQQVLKKQIPAPKSMFGTLKGIKWKKQDKMELHEL